MGSPVKIQGFNIMAASSHLLLFGEVDSLKMSSLPFLSEDNVLQKNVCGVSTVRNFAV